MRVSKLILLFIFFVIISIHGKKQLKLTVDAGNYSRENAVVCMDLNQSELDFFSEYSVFEVVKGKEIEVSSQLEVLQDGSKLYWILSGKTPEKSLRTFMIKGNNRKKKDKSSQLQVIDKDGGLIIMNEQSPVLQYVYKTIYPPPGIDTAFKRSGFIHPVWSPSGDTLTNIQPQDHYHHFGIWNPWTRLEYNSKVFDLWNLGDKRGTVRFDKILNIYQGDVFAGYKVLQNHYIFEESGEKNIMSEISDVKVWNYPGKASFLWNFESELTPNTTLPVILKTYRYGGFTIRATDYWNKDNCTMMTSEGKQRFEIDGTKARWIYLTGDSPKGGKTGILFMSSPSNYNHPEPLRIWDENANGGRGDAFINFSPTKDMDWILKPGKKHSLCYRILVYDGEITPEKANQLWTDFAYPITIKIDK